MIERFDKRNIALWKALESTKKTPEKGKIRHGRAWKPIRYYPTIEKAIKGACTLSTVGEITFKGDMESIIDEVKKCSDKIDLIARGFKCKSNY